MGKLARIGVVLLMGLALGLARLIEVELQPVQKARLVIEAPVGVGAESVDLEAAASERARERPAPLAAQPAAEAPPPMVPVAPEPKTYEVRKGDTLGKISQQAYGTTRHWKKILEANRKLIPSEKKLRPGMILVLPAVGELP